MEEGVERPSCDVAVAVAVAAAAAAVAVAARGVADMQKVALDIEGSRIPVAIAPELGCRYGHVAHGSAMTRLMLESSIAEYGRLVADTVFAACGQPPLCRVLLLDLVSLSRPNPCVIFECRKQSLRTCGRKLSRYRGAVGTWGVINVGRTVTVSARNWLRIWGLVMERYTLTRRVWRRE